MQPFPIFPRLALVFLFICSLSFNKWMLRLYLMPVLGVNSDNLKVQLMLLCGPISVCCCCMDLLVFCCCCSMDLLAFCCCPQLSWSAFGSPESLNLFSLTEQEENWFIGVHWETYPSDYDVTPSIFFFSFCMPLPKSSCSRYYDSFL